MEMEECPGRAEALLLPYDAATASSPAPSRNTLASQAFFLHLSQEGGLKQEEMVDSLFVSNNCFYLLHAYCVPVLYF